MKRLRQALKKAGIFCFLIFAAIATHYAYCLLNPQWITYRKAENAYHRKQWDDAIVLYKKAIDQGLSRPEALSRLGNAYTEVKNYTQAIRWYKSYLAEKPNELWAYKALAGLYTANGEFEKAAKTYQYLLENEKYLSHDDH